MLTRRDFLVSVAALPVIGLAFPSANVVDVFGASRLQSAIHSLECLRRAANANTVSFNSFRDSCESIRDGFNDDEYETLMAEVWRREDENESA